MADVGDSLGATIRAWRDRLAPSAVGLPSGRTRRATGLRREELAELAGISVDYVVRLEQGRATTPSAQVVAALARALQLTDDERDHLFRLACLLPPSDREISDHVPPGLSRVLNRLGEGTAVAVFAADWQMIWWNRAWAALAGDPSQRPPRARSFARATFPTGSGDPQGMRWTRASGRSAEVEAAVVSDLRRASGRFPDSRRLHALVAELLAGNARFAELWSTGAVGAHREDRKTIHHPLVGPVEVDCDVIGDDDRKVVILSAEPGSDDESKVRLAVVHGPVPSLVP